MQVHISAAVIEAQSASLEELGIDLEGAMGGAVTAVIGPEAGGAAGFAGRLSEQGAGRVLAEPNATTASGEAAQIELGGEVPSSAGQPEPSPKEFRVALDVTPEITPDGSIRLGVKPSVTQVDLASLVPSAAPRTPAVTESILAPGGGIAIGGLLQPDAPDLARKVPALGDLPVLGSLFRSQAFQQRETEFLVVITASVVGEEGSRAGSAPAGLIYTAAAEGGVFVQDLPSNSGGLGVVDVGGSEDFFLAYPGSITGGLGGASLAAWNLGPTVAGISTHLYLGGWYGQGDDDESKERAGDPGIVNGISFWQPAANGSTGNASAGAGLRGEMDFELQAFQVRAKLLADVTEPFEDVCPCCCPECDEDYDEEGPLSPVARALRGLRPTYFVEASARVGYLRQDASQVVDLLNDDPGFALFDVGSENDLDVEEWSGIASLGFIHLRPIPWVKGLSAQLGFDVGIGYRDSSADGHQRNRCDVRFAAAPGVNACAPEVQDFTLRADLDDSGFDWDLGASAGLYYQRPIGRFPVFASVGWDFGYIGVSRVDTGPNIIEEGPLHLERTHQARNAVTFRLGIAFP
jgi:hypothetical protein